MNRLLAAALRSVSLRPVVAESRELASAISDHDQSIELWRRDLASAGAVVFGDEHVLTGNADLPEATYRPRAQRPMPPLPGREHLHIADLDLVGAP